MRPEIFYFLKTIIIGRYSKFNNSETIGTHSNFELYNMYQHFQNSNWLNDDLQ